MKNIYYFASLLLTKKSNTPVSILTYFKNNFNNIGCNLIQVPIFDVKNVCTVKLTGFILQKLAE